MFKSLPLAIAIIVGTLTTASAQEHRFDDTVEQLTDNVAGAFYDPGPTFVAEFLSQMRDYRAVDLGLNLTALTTYQVGNVLFDNDYQGVRRSDNGATYLAQQIIIQDIRGFLANPNYLTGLWYQVKMTAVPTVLNNLGQTRANTWLSPAAPLFTQGGFDPTLGASYEDWRTNGCQWYLQTNPDQGYTPAMSEEDCAEHSFVKDLAGVRAVADTEFVNLAHWYGFLWRRYLEGDSGLVTAWQSILNDVAMATQSH